MTIKEICLKSNLSQKTIRRHIHAGALLAEKVGSTYKISNNNFQLWFENISKHKERINQSSIFNMNKEEVNQDEWEEISIEKDFDISHWNNFGNNKIKFADFFAGAGGLTTGFIDAGYKPIYSVEILRPAVETYNNNIGAKFNERILETRDITDKTIKENAIKKLKEEKVDVIIGGFPCQGFSMAGSRVVDDPRNSLYLHMWEIIKKVKPKVVVMENVTGLRTMLDGKVEMKIIEDFQKIGYKISAKTINSANFKVPQQRKRVIFVANKMNIKNLYPKSIVEEKKWLSVREAIEDLQNINENKMFNHEFTSHKEEMIKKMKNLKEGESLYKGYSDAWKKVRWEKPSPTVKENHGGVFIHPKKNRVMTPRELARLQSFPDDFIFSGSKKWQLVQIGNAVPPLMAKAVALSVKKMLKNKP